MNKRQSFDKAFTAKVVLEALREELTLQEIAKNSAYIQIKLAYGLVV